MNETNKLEILFVLLIVGGIIVIFVSIQIISSTGLQPADAVPIYVGVIGFFATVVTTLYKTISEGYAEKRANAQKRWELVFPILKDSYVPWMNAAEKLRDALIKERNNRFTTDEVNKILYYACLFYGIRLRFILKHGGLILLGTKEEENNVKNAYKKIKNSFQWNDQDTQKSASELQEFFIINSKENDPLVFKNFEDAINGKFVSISSDTDRSKGNVAKIQPQYHFKSHRDHLQTWLNVSPQNSKNTISALNNFVDVFDLAISKFSGRDS